MVCRFMDSFDYYSTAQMSRKWRLHGSTSFTEITSVTVRTGGNSYEGGFAFGFLDRTFDNQATWIIGFAYYPFTFNTGGSTALVQIRDEATTHCTLRVNSNGLLEVFRSTAVAVTDGRATSLPLHYRTWNYIEWKVTIADSIAADSCKVRVNEVEVINVAAGQDLQSTANAAANVIRINGNTSQQTGFIDDLYIFDGTEGGGTEPTNDDFAGDVKVAAHFPDGNGATSDFLGSDGNSVDNHLLVDENPADDDSTYTESSTPGEIDLYTFDDLATTPNSIKAIQINSITKKSDAGSRTIRSVTRPVSTNFLGASKSPSVASYINEIEILNEDPETGLAWTEAGFNATEFGIEIEA